ncbi:MAG: ester cyclase [Actinomycetota bacterium]|nr:ester cyclase [Actinomycetota bacterium]
MHTATATPGTEAVRALLHRFVDEVINGRDLDRALAELVAEDFVEQNPLPGQGPGRAGLGDVLAGMFAGFPDLRWDIQETVVEADRVASFSFWTGTHQGEFLGIPATGRTVKVEAWNLDRFQDGQLTESRIIMDVIGLLTQLGAIPAPAAS